MSRAMPTNSNRALGVMLSGAALAGLAGRLHAQPAGGHHTGGSVAARSGADRARRASACRLAGRAAACGATGAVAQPVHVPRTVARRPCRGRSRRAAGVTGDHGADRRRTRARSHRPSDRLAALGHRHERRWRHGRGREWRRRRVPAARRRRPARRRWHRRGRTVACRRAHRGGRRDAPLAVAGQRRRPRVRGQSPEVPCESRERRARYNAGPVLTWRPFEGWRG